MARNTNRQGANFELEVMHYLEKYGYTCMRSSGSKGKIDVLAIGKLTFCACGCGAQSSAEAPVLFIQCKITCPPHRSPLSPAERMNLMDLALRANAEPMTASKAKDIVTGRIRPHFRRLTGPGPRDWEPWEPGEDN